MAKKQNTKRRTRVKDLPQKGRKLSSGDLKKVKGGAFQSYTEFREGGVNDTTFKNPPRTGQPK